MISQEKTRPAPGPQLTCPGCLALRRNTDIHLNDLDLAFLEGHQRRRRLPKRQFLFHDDERPEGVYCVSTGSLKLFKTGPDGAEHIVSVALPGTLLGVRAFFADEPYSVSASAREDSTLCFYDAQSFKQLIDRSPGASKALLGFLGKQLRVTREELLERSAAPAGARLIHSLLHLEEQFKAQAKPIRISGQDLAAMIGTAPETVSRLLAKYVQAGLLGHTGREIKIVNRAGLRVAAEAETSPAASKRSEYGAIKSVVS